MKNLEKEREKSGETKKEREKKTLVKKEEQCGHVPMQCGSHPTCSNFKTTRASRAGVLY